ncbi:MAG: hypothetical protein IJR68_06925, partial [Fretibacterium sp.]|nr:hypothetical protein [Fretibacterium sp.]
NSIIQGEQVPILWRQLSHDGVHIDFAWRTFVWNSEATDKAHVHVVIIGFSQADCGTPKRIFDVDGKTRQAANISPYLIETPSVLIGPRSQPICDVPSITYGNKPSDGGNLILSQEERDALIGNDPKIALFVRRYIGSRDFINNDETRYCLWLKDVPANLYSHNKEIMRRLECVRQMRLASTAAPTRAMADMPYSFFQRLRPMPRASASRRSRLRNENIFLSGFYLVVLSRQIRFLLFLARNSIISAS